MKGPKSRKKVSKFDKSLRDKMIELSKTGELIMKDNISFSNYDEVGPEGSLIVMKRKNNALPVIESLPDSIFTTLGEKDPGTFSNDFLAQEDSDSVRLFNFKNHFLLFAYQEFRQATSPDDIPYEISTYSKNFHISIAKYIGFSLFDPNNKEVPCILTERPINGPLSIYFSNDSHFNSSSDSIKSTDSKDYSIINDRFQTKNIEFTPQMKLIMIIGIAAGIEFIHRNNKVHAHLDPTTVYLDDNLQPIICGYGFIEPLNIDDDSDDDGIGNDREDSRLSFLTNISFVAPEVLKYNRIYQSSDIFSIGMLMYYILSEMEPFKNLSPNVQFQNICEGRLPAFPECIDVNWKKLIFRCCEFNPKKRLTAKELLSFLLQEENKTNLLASISQDKTAKFTKSQNEYLTHIRDMFEFDDDFRDSYIITDMILDPTLLSIETKTLIDSATKGDPQSLETVGLYFMEGKNNLPEDKNNGFELIKKAADLNFPSSIKIIINLYQKGIGTDKNLDYALYYCDQAKQLYNDNEEEFNNICAIAQEIKAEKEKIASNKEEQLQKESESNLFASARDIDDIEAISLREKELKNLNKRKITLKSLPSFVTTADFEQLFKKYQNIQIELFIRARYSSATVIFETQEDKKDVEKKCRKNKNFLKIRNKVLVPKLTPTKQEIKRMQTKNFREKLKKKRIERLKKETKDKKKHAKEEEEEEEQSEQVEPQVIAKDTSVFSLTTVIKEQVNLEDYTPGEGRNSYKKIGGGSFGDVYEAYNKKDGKLCAAKVFIKKFENPKQRLNFFREIDILKKLDCPLIVKLYGYNMNSLIQPISELPTLFMEFATHGTLSNMIQQEYNKHAHPKWNNTTKMKTIIGITRAMAYMHSQLYLHRDLKTENIFFDENYEPKIGDFGCSRKIDKQNSVNLTLGVGSPIYMAPEILLGSNPQYSWEVDVYSFAIVLYQIITGKPDTKVYEDKYLKNLFLFQNYMIKEDIRPKLPEDLDENLKMLLSRCWSSRVNDRPSFNFIFSVLKATFEQEHPPTTFLPNVDLDEVRKYLKKLDSCF